MFTTRTVRTSVVCNACSFVCCALDTMQACGCEDCENPECDIICEVCHRPEWECFCDDEGDFADDESDVRMYG
jgi:hypothetical protein